MEKKNRMTYQSIAIVFGPTLLKPERETGNIAVHTVYQNQIVELILLELSTVFGRWLLWKTAYGIDAGFQDFKSYTWCVSFWTKQWLWFCTFLRVREEEESEGTSWDLICCFVGCKFGFILSWMLAFHPPNISKHQNSEFWPVIYTG